MKKFLLFALSLSLASFLPNEQSREEKINIIVLGSSTAEGAGPSDRNQAWVNRYRTHLQTLNPAINVINLARGGYTTYHVMPDHFAPPADRPAPDKEHNLTKALALHPAALIINLPSNDATHDYTINISCECGINLHHRAQFRGALFLENNIKRRARLF